MDTVVVEVDLGERSYPVVIGAGAITELGALIPAQARRAAVVTQDGVGVVADPGIEHRTFVIGDGEAYKTLATVEDLCRGWAQWGLTRNDVVVAVGGGIVTDVAGFAAAVYHRGVDVVYVSTTLLGQIDAAVGGKTGVNLPEGKNLVGAFWQPRAVVCDTDVLATMDVREWRCGYGEMAKYRFLGADDLTSRSLRDQIARCVEIKADVVASDEREGGRRAVLNYGHTLAHALEIDGEFGLRHGEAVAVGLHYAAVLAHRLGRIDADAVAEHRAVLAHYELVDTLPAGADAERLVDLFSRDKKAVDGVTFVLDGPDGVEPVRIDDRRLLLDAIEAIR
ncbi:MAG: 3-dehydroquinate synthase family protein [Acidimicrobiales bacterium]